MLKVSADLTTVDKFQRDNGWPLSNVIVAERQQLILVGLGGLQTISSSEVRHD